MEAMQGLHDLFVPSPNRQPKSQIQNTFSCSFGFPLKATPKDERESIKRSFAPSPTAIV
jgi:hypothetical protein